MWRTDPRYDLTFVLFTIGVVDPLGVVMDRVGGETDDSGDDAETVTNVALLELMTVST